MNRECPKCTAKTIPVKTLLFRDVRCSDCANVIGVHRVAAIVSSVLIFVVAVASTLVVFLAQGLYAALLWITLPVGALGYVRARFSPLQIKSAPIAPE